MVTENSNRRTWKDASIQRTDFKNWVTLKELEVDMSDDDLKTTIKSWLSIAWLSDKILITNWDINKAYYRWLDSRTKDIVSDRSKVTDNRIFTNLETIVPIVTSSPAKPIVFIPWAQGKDKDSKNKVRDQAIQTQKLLLALYEKLKLQRKFEKIVRQHNIYRIGIVKYWIKDDEIFTEVILPSRILIDSEATTMEDSEFIGEKIVSTAKALIERFPDKESEISKEVQGKLWTKITYMEWWSDEIMVTSIDSKIILDKKKNPLFDYKWIIEETFDKFWEVKEVTTKFNVFNKPRKPYIRFTVYNIGENIIDDTTPLELSKSLQDWINDRKRQLWDNAETVWNPIKTYKWFTSDQSAEANENLRAWDWVNLSDDQEINYIQAAPLPAHIQNDLTDSRNSIDNIFGIHSTTRGERLWGESWIARQALREWDEDRQATIGRAIEEVSEELYNAWLHLIKVFYDKPQLIPVIWKESTGEFLEAKREDIAEWVKIKVKPWSTIPDDPNAIRAQALELAKLWKITDRRLFEALKIDDADEAVKELELEQVKAQQAQEKLLAKEKTAESNIDTANTITEQIEKLT